jgi:hypothetical protein
VKVCNVAHLLKNVKMIAIEKVKIGELVKVGNGVFIRGAYCRETKKYSLTNWHDVSNEKFIKKGVKVDINFTF